MFSSHLSVYLQDVVLKALGAEIVRVPAAPFGTPGKCELHVYILLCLLLLSSAFSFGINLFSHLFV